MKTAVLYARVSSNQQFTEGDSIDWQIDKMRSYCDFSGIEVLEVFQEEEGISAGTPLEARKAGAKMVDYIKRHKPDYVVSYSLSRIFRNAGNGFVLTETWKKHGTSLCLLDCGGQSIDPSSALGRMFLSCLLAFSELEKNVTGERVASSLAFKKKNKQVYARVPFGFSRNGEKLEVNSEQIDIVKEMHQLRNQGYSLGKIANTMNDKGITGNKGGKFYACSISHILSNNIYNEFIEA